MGSTTRGALAGVAGTVAMTASQVAEMRLTRRAPSLVPGQVAARALRLDPGPATLARLSTGVHWGHGVLQGAVRGRLARTGLDGPAAAVVHLGLMWGGDALAYRLLGIAPWPWRWSRQDLLTDLGHKGVLAVVTNAAYARLA